MVLREKDDADYHYNHYKNDPTQENLDVEFPTPKEGPSLDEMMRRYGFIIFKEWTKTKSNQEVEKK